jgi:uncharacterized protein
MSLPRRAFLGIALDGAEVEGVISGSMAEAAGIRRGDRLLAVDGQPLEMLDRVLRSIAPKARVAIAIRREDQRIELDVNVVPRPMEDFEGHDVAYSEVEVEAIRQRTIMTRPRGEGPFPAIVFLQGIGEASIETSLAPLVSGFAQEGFGTLRVEKLGIGDSEGEPSERHPLVEIAAFEKAIGRLRQEPWISKVALFGHSLGGMLAPFLAPRADAIVVYGTSARPWLDCVEASTRRQLALRGVDERQIDRRAEAERSAATSYDRELHALDVVQAWRRVTCPTLVLHGEHDWVVSEEEARAILSLAPQARFETIAGADHAFSLHANEAESLMRYGASSFASAIVDIASKFVR